MVPPRSDRISRVPPYSRTVGGLLLRGYHALWPDFPDGSNYVPTATGLVRVRSPLLAESRLMSFPPVTEMFQFTGFASRTYGFSAEYPCGWVAPFGNPRIKACSRLPMAYRRVPRPSSPLCAKASTRCPSLLDPVTRRGKSCAKRFATLAARTTPLAPRGSAEPCVRSGKTYSRCQRADCPRAIRRFPIYWKRPMSGLRLDDADSEPPLQTSALWHLISEVVEANGIEPMTSCLQSRRSPD